LPFSNFAPARTAMVAPEYATIVTVTLVPRRVCNRKDTVGQRFTRRARLRPRSDISPQGYAQRNRFTKPRS
jgi:hypothetical protein